MFEKRQTLIKERKNTSKHFILRYFFAGGFFRLTPWIDQTIYGGAKNRHCDRERFFCTGFWKLFPPVPLLSLLSWHHQLKNWWVRSTNQCKVKWLSHIKKTLILRKCVSIKLRNSKNPETKKIWDKQHFILTFWSF